MEMKEILLLILLIGLPSLNSQKLFCENEKKDVVIILDDSGSISHNDFNYAKHAIIKTIHLLKVSQSHSRVAFEQFGTDANIVFNLDTFNNDNEMIKAIKNSKHTGGVTAIGKALALTTEKILPKMRNDAMKIVAIFTDGTNNVYPTPQIFADKLKSKGVRIIAVGIGSEINKPELRRLVSHKSVYLISSFEHLLKNIKRITDHLCYRPDPVPLKPCTVPQQDLVFLIDRSSSISDPDFEKSKNFVKTIIEKVKLGNDATRVALILFSDDPEIVFNIDTYTNRKDYIRSIDNSKTFGGITGIGKALKEVLANVWPKRRKSVPFNIVLVTDGVNNIYPKPQIPATELKANGAHIVSVGVGENIDLDDLRAISSDHKVITVLDYSQLLKNVASVQKIITCE